MVRGNNDVWESIIYLYFFSFLLFFYFFSGIGTIKRSLAYCVAVPFLCCALSSITYVIAPFIGGWELPIEGIGDAVKAIAIISGGVLYFIFGWIVSISLFLVCLFHLCLQKLSKSNSETLPLLYFPLFRKNLIDLKSLKYNKFALITGFAYIVFMSLYYRIFREQWTAPQKVFSAAVYPCLLSVFSVLYLTPTIFNKMKKLSAGFMLLLCCMLLPFFWSALARTVYAVLIYTITSNTKFFRSEILSVDFYLHRYIETRAWFISLLLVLICVIYYYFAKSELIKNAQESQPGN